MNRPLAFVTIVASFWCHQQWLSLSGSQRRLPYWCHNHYTSRQQAPTKGTSTLWLCSNEICPDKSKYQQGATCASCGSQVQNYGFTESMRHMNAKDKAKNVKQAIEQGEAKILFS